MLVWDPSREGEFLKIIDQVWEINDFQGSRGKIASESNIQEDGCKSVSGGSRDRFWSDVVGSQNRFGKASEKEVNFGTI